ncbi:hypothetical protein JO380_001970 [Cellulomonas iranensis]|uniref:Uncharacterized protein n=1 Tax=Cellulomonas iranensis TaxID=76862 RepID=A0ABU0GKW9_9CELL|nr:hypothetical protein [Cellulomonas iranensis]
MNVTTSPARPVASCGCVAKAGAYRTSSVAAALRECGVDGLEPLAPGRQRVDVDVGGRGQVLAREDAVLLELVQTLREDRGADADDVALQLREPLGPEQQLADDDHRPPVAHDVERVRGRAPVVVGAVRPSSCHDPSVRPLLRLPDHPLRLP